MKKLIGLIAGVLLSFSVYAGGEHLADAVEHAKAAAGAANSEEVTAHATEAMTHAKAAGHNAHAMAGVKSLQNALDHAKAGHTDAAKKSAAEAVTHLEAAEK
ncbi:small metal-binding protein SmbP [Candidatus Nitrosacidococcus sp. I8]|uniref:small metal-binding protein SmbP n=1 Tax=Candidatus Nitrosacidococcus sp. I8 TaxID=2942908 RepID=UPI002227A5FD|nr:small metal-binding protein SmbP [Candidatus Nitrosacidococcus sp. I8]CAH9019518.1 Metal-binding protein SmbP [Candidatus Nitrosacidococcus sp. I8]